MRAIVLKKFGSPAAAFSLEEQKTPVPKAHEIGIKVEAFGLNFADIMARQGLYEDCPKPPTIIGYEVVGRIDAIGKDVKGLEIGQRVVSMTRFGGYASYAVADARAAAVIGDDMDAGEAAALATQYCTAYYAAEELVRLHEGDHVLIQAAAGGVGTALVQIAKNRGCVVYGTAGSEKKLEYLRGLGVDFPINYRNQDFAEVIKAKRGEEGLDVVFDSLGGKPMRKGLSLLGSGGRIVCYGAASRSGGGFGSTLKLAMGFGLMSPIPLLMKSRSVIGLNMLRIADDRPNTLKRCLEGVVSQVQAGILKPTVGGRFTYKQINEAHEFLEGRKSIGKVVVYWKDNL